MLAGSALGGDNPQHKIAAHIIPHGAACKTLPAFATCADIQTTYSGLGDIDVIPVFFDLNEVIAVEFGLDWPAEWGTMAYVRCAGDLPVGDIVNPGDGIATAWTTCQRVWSVAHGYGWLVATGPGRVSIVRDPPTGDYGVVDCSPEPGPYLDYPALTFAAGVGGAAGEDPCETIFLPLALDKDDGLSGSCVSPGNFVTYSMTYDNPDNIADVHNVVLEDALPVDLAFVLASAGGVYDSLDHRVTWDLGTLAPDEGGSVDLVCQVDAEMGATLTNTCTLVSDEAPASEARTATRVCNATYSPLGLVKDDGLAGDGCVYKGDDLTYTITFDNYANTGAVHGVELVDYLPALTAFVSAGGGGVYNAGTRTVTWQIGTLQAGGHGHRSLTLTVNAARGSTIVNNCGISSEETPASQAARYTNVCWDAVALNLSKGDGLSGDCAYNGDTLTYTLSYQNKSDAEVANVELTDDLPDQTEFVSASSGGAYLTWDHAVTWSIGSLGPLESGSQEVRARVTAAPGATVTNTCQITGDQVPTATASEATTVCSTVYRTLDLAKVASVGSCVAYGDTITYTIAYGNTANHTEVTNAVLVDLLPGQTAFVSASAGGAYDGGDRVRWDLGTLAPGETGSQQVTLAVHVALGVSFTNRCTLTSSEAPVSEANKTLTVCGSGGRNDSHKIAVHIKAHPTSCTENFPTFTSCSQIVSTYAGCGDVDAIPVFFDLVEYCAVEFGLEWPAEWGTCEFAICKGDLSVGGITNPGDGIAIAWTACQYTWSVAPGVAWLLASGPGEIWIRPNPSTGDVGVVNCAPSPGPYYDYPIAVGKGGVCGTLGDDPCHCTKLQPTTWGAIKAMFK